jgi:menaquinone-specific isochorismate synthase
MSQETQKQRPKREALLHSHTRKVPMRAPLEVLAGLPEGPRFAWLSADTTWVAQGKTSTLQADGPGRLEVLRGEARGLWESLHHERDADVPETIGPILVGGFAFHERHQAEAHWQAFPGTLFVLPQRLWQWRGDALYETTTTSQRPETPRKPLAGEAASRDDPSSVGTPREEWEKSVQKVLQQIRSGDVTKVVLARAKRLPPVDPVRLLSAFPDEAGTHRFLFEPVAGQAFLGATPEPLVRVTGVTAETVALAGTAARGMDAQNDKTHAQQLIESPKDNLEHGLTVTWLDERLSQAGALRVEHGKRRLRRLGHVQHLETPITAQIPAGMHVLDVARELHPTPAVGGVPPREGLGLIARLENTPRGWYAGGVGWFSRSGEGTIVTAIRSALSTKEALWAYAGAGIVAGSDPKAEWEETRLKMRMVERAAQALDEGS